MQAQARLASSARLLQGGVDDAGAAFALGGVAAGNGGRRSGQARDILVVLGAARAPTNMQKPEPILSFG